MIERLVLLTDHSGVSARELERFLPPALAVPIPVPAASPLAMPPAYETPPVLAAQPAPLVRGYLGVGSHSAAQLQQALAAHGGNQSRAAQAIGLTVRQFGYRLRKINPGGVTPPDNL